MKNKQNQEIKTTISEMDTHPDPITGAPGSHPIGTGLGAAGAGALGAAIGAIAGPVGSLAGAAIGAVVGGLAGKGVAEAVDPTTEEAYWQENYKKRPYVDKESGFKEFRPAYRYGWESRTLHRDKSFEEVEAELGADWDSVRGESALSWEKARHATRDAFHRLDEERLNPEPGKATGYSDTGTETDKDRGPIGL